MTEENVRMSYFITTVFHKPFKNGSVFCELTDEGADLLSYKEVVHVPLELLNEQEHMYNVKVRFLSAQQWIPSQYHKQIGCTHRELIYNNIKNKRCMIHNYYTSCVLYPLKFFVRIALLS